MTSAERQARLRERRAQAGITQVTVWAPAGAAASLKEAAERMCGNPDLSVRLYSTRTGKVAPKGTRAVRPYRNRPRKRVG